MSGHEEREAYMARFAKMTAALDEIRSVAIGRMQQVRRRSPEGKVLRVIAEAAADGMKPISRVRP